MLFFTHQTPILPTIILISLLPFLILSTVRPTNLSYPSIFPINFILEQAQLLPQIFKLLNLVLQRCQALFTRMMEETRVKWLLLERGVFDWGDVLVWGKQSDCLGLEGLAWVGKNSMVGFLDRVLRGVNLSLFVDIFNESFASPIPPSLIQLNKVRHWIEVALNFRIISNFHSVDERKLFLNKNFCLWKISLLGKFGQNKTDLVVLLGFSLGKMTKKLTITVHIICLIFITLLYFPVMKSVIDELY